MREIILPKLNNNDDECQLVEWKVTERATVSEGDIVAVVETSKATYDLATDYDGIIQQIVQAGNLYPFGVPIARVFGDAEEFEEFAKQKQAKGEADSEDATSDLVLSKRARELAEKHGVSTAELKALGKKTIKERDVNQLLVSRSSPEFSGVGELEGEPLPRRQVAIARTVTRTHQEVPAAFLAMKMDCDKALAASKAISVREKIMVGLPELIVKHVAELAPKFPFFFGHVNEDHRFVKADSIGVGVTFDLGQGLFIPVVKDASNKSVKDIANELIDFRDKAMTNRFIQQDLSGGSISISLNFENSVVHMVPIILSGQSCMLSLGAISEEVRLKDGQPYGVQACHLGVAYDHRVINGSDATSFATALKNKIESPTEL